MQLDYQSHQIHLTTPLVVAVSGGPDSLGLLHLFKEKGFKHIIVAHLDHQIREDSWRDAELVRKTAAFYNFTFELKQVPIKKSVGKSKENLEAAGRDERYAFFRQLKKKYKAKYIVTAHHADDQVETVLLNILRGTGLDGLGGMKTVEGDLWRPLLNCSKKDLETYCKKHRLKFVRESTNNDLAYRRNFLRMKVVPLFKKLNPNFLRTMENNIRIWNSAAEYLQRESEKTLKSLRLKQHRYDLKKFLHLDEALQGFVIRGIFEEVHGHKKNLQQSHLDQILKILRTNVSGKKKEFGAGKMLMKQKTFFEIQDR